jgi:hypothetical protein
MRFVRIAAVLLVTAAAFATATAPKTQDAVQKGVILSEGGSAGGLCPPDRVCR